MGNLNKAMIIGRLGADPEVRYTQANTAIANFNVATTDKYRDANGETVENTEWHRIVAWGKLAEFCQKFMKKGSQVFIEGPIQTRQWEDKEGQKRYTTEIKALTIQLLDSKGDGSGAKPSSPSGPTLDPGGDDDLPF